MPGESDDQHLNATYFYVRRRALAELVNLHARAGKCKHIESIFMKVNTLLDSSVKDTVKETLLVTVGSIGW